jgi:hypothetical protein
MFKSVTAKSIVAIMSAALGIGEAFFSTAVASEAKAQVVGGLHQPLAKGDRLSVLAKGAACSSLGWPHYERKCQFDMRRPADEMPAVRIIALR